MSDLTQEEWDALSYWVAAHGSKWKRELRKLWESGSCESNEQVLYSLRNTKGPAWLAGFSFKKAKARGGSMTDKHEPIRVGDRFKYGDRVLEVIGTKPGGKIELFDRERTRFTDSWHRIVKTWERIIP